MENLIEKVEKWGNDKGIVSPENVDKQFMKFIEEVFEFKNEITFMKWTDQGSEKDLKMEMGDILVTLIIMAKQLNIDLEDCLSMAYNKISKRKGKTIDGTFVKEEDL